MLARTCYNHYEKFYYYFYLCFNIAYILIAYRHTGFLIPMCVYSIVLTVKIANINYAVRSPKQ